MFRDASMDVLLFTLLFLAEESALACALTGLVWSGLVRFGKTESLRSGLVREVESVCVPEGSGLEI